jgi:hypothetical protein
VNGAINPSTAVMYATPGFDGWPLGRSGYGRVA